jgi:hypothetical protein
VDQKISLEKLSALIEVGGYKRFEYMMEIGLFDVVCPAICCNPDCNYVCEMQSDQDRGWCEECRTASMKSGLVLAELI